jgi:hypothetical protein
MDSKFQTSFIPKSQPSVVARPEMKGKKSSVANAISVALVLGIIIAWGALFGLNFVLEKDINVTRANIEGKLENINPEQIKDIARLSDRLFTIKNLLSFHIAPSILFDVLENNTQQSVQLKSLNFSYEPNGTIKINGTGESIQFESLVSQSSKYAKAGLKDVLFADLQTVSTDRVTFSLSATVDRDTLLYKSKFENAIKTQ